MVGLSRDWLWTLIVFMCLWTFIVSLEVVFDVSMSGVYQMSMHFHYVCMYMYGKGGLWTFIMSLEVVFDVCMSGVYQMSMHKALKL